MKRLSNFLTFLLLFLSVQGFSQDSKTAILDNLFGKANEIYFSLPMQDRATLDQLTTVISIDNLKCNEVFAYANRDEFGRFLDYHIPYSVLQHPGTLLDDKALRMGLKETDANNLTVWNFYPTYQQYLDFMAGFATTYPSICKLDTIGTTIQGRLLLAVKISDSVNLKQGEPRFFYTSSIHGDELTGYVSMLHLIDYLLTNYGTDPRITDMVDNTEIFINPLANPDGTYHGGNNTVNGATRGNANGIDMNRNFPDPADGPHPDGNAWQPETVEMMDWADTNHFSMSMNFHGGAEVFNYPWDTWAKLHADDAWWQFVGREYADTVHKYSPPGYMTDEDNGVTNGYAWYRITGGRQDYMTYFQNGREVTLEMSYVKTPPANQLLSYWNYNFHSFLNYIDQVRYGINGKVSDSVTGIPLQAKVFIFGHDIDNSYVYSWLPSGYYYRPINKGSWNLTFSCSGYHTKSVNNINVTKYNTTHVDVQLVPLWYGISEQKAVRTMLVAPNPNDGTMRLIIPENARGDLLVEVFSIAGEKVFSRNYNSVQFTLTLDLSGIPSGLYLVKLTSGKAVLTDRFIKH